MSRHLLYPTHLLSQYSTHLAQQKSTSSKTPLILGLQPTVFFMLCGAFAIIFTICCCIFIIVRRKRTLQDYNQNPQRFPNLPDLSYFQQRHLKNSQFVPLIKSKTSGQELSIKKVTDQYAGPYYKIVFKGKQPQAVIFQHEQKYKNCYFEMQVISLQGQVQMGFVQVQSKQKVANKQQTIGFSGVSLSTSGFVITNGENIYNYNWSLNHGDVIGIGMTKESDKFNERRAWISKNGLLLNPPPHEELDKWLATVNITAEQRQKFTKQKEKQQNDQEFKDAEAADKAAQAAQAAFQKQQAVLESQRVQMKTFKQFKFYPVVFYQGQKIDRNINDKKQKNTALNINVGGQVFRMQQSQFKGGILA